MSPTPLVAITGISGFVSFQVGLCFLAAGWRVRGSVRTQTTAEYIRNHPKLARYRDTGRLQLVVVPDLAGGEFTDLLQDAEAVSIAESLSQREKDRER